MDEESDGLAPVRTGGANHFRGVLAVNGQLTLTGADLRFKAGRLNLQSYEASIPLAEIAAVQPRRGLALVGDGMAVVLHDGREERFVVFGRGEWIRQILAARDALPTPAGTP
jgi:hypothetical protein